MLHSIHLAFSFGSVFICFTCLFILKKKCMTRRTMQKKNKLCACPSGTGKDGKCRTVHLVAIGLGNKVGVVVEAVAGGISELQAEAFHAAKKKHERGRTKRSGAKTKALLIDSNRVLMPKCGEGVGVDLGHTVVKLNKFLFRRVS